MDSSANSPRQYLLVLQTYLLSAMLLLMANVDIDPDLAIHILLWTAASAISLPHPATWQAENGSG